VLIEACARITRVVECRVTADIEVGYGNALEEVLQTVKAVITTDFVCINFEDSLKQQEKALADVSYQEELANQVLAIATINAWNRFDIGVRYVPGRYKPTKHQEKSSMKG
jgi:2-methylisocitrate lyase-like PEP mutase family enzyme